MPQTPEAQAFLARIAALPPGPGVTDTITQALQPSLDDEAALRKLFATDRGNARLKDPHVGLIDVFDAPPDIRTTRARVVTNDEDLTSKYVMPVPAERRRKDGAPAMVASLDEFRKTWAIFTEGSLSQLTDWSNVVAAGGAVQACLAPVPEAAKASKRAMRKYFHTDAFPSSDVDLFLYGLTPEQAEVKMQAIYAAVCDSVPWDVTCVRTKHTVSIHSQYPYRSVQIVLRLYSSPAEVLAGFDVDAPCCAYDGDRVWVNPRAAVAMMRQCNTVDMDRRSPSYEVRLTKYAKRDFEVYVPSLRREDIDPTIFERSIQRVQGLARLLVLEKLSDADTRTKYLMERRTLRARPQADVHWSRRFKKKLRGDLKADLDFGGLEMNDYDVVSLHIPYGPGWDARRIDKLVYQTDLGMNSPYNPKNKNRRLHRHPAFFGTMHECLEDCCEYCVEPHTKEEKELDEKETESYVRGRIAFIEEDPGRQSMSGSFNPIDVGDWEEHAYMGPTERLFNAIIAEDRAAVAKIVQEGTTDLDRRDHVGRTPLQVAILSKATDIACDLIDAGARMSSRIVDGRTALHLVAQLDLPVVARKLLERSAVNKEKAEEEEEAAKAKAGEEDKEDKMDVDDDGAEKKKKRRKRKSDEDDEDDGDDEDDENDEDAQGEDDDDEGDRDSSEDDWSSQASNSGDAPAKDKKDAIDASQIPEDDAEDVPDVLDVNAQDWDYVLTPLQYAVMLGSTSVVDELLAGGADAKLMTKSNEWGAKPLHPLTLTAVTYDPKVSTEIAKKLFAAGAVSSEADPEVFTIFHSIVCQNKPLLVDTFLRNDPNAKLVLDTAVVREAYTRTIFPIMSAIAVGNYSTLAVLLAHGAKFKFTEEDVSRARELRKDNAYGGRAGVSWQAYVPTPIELAVANRYDLVELFLAIGAEVNTGVVQAHGAHNNNGRYNRTVREWIHDVIPALELAVKDLETTAEKCIELHTKRELAALPGWQGEVGKRLVAVAESGNNYQKDQCDRMRVGLQDSLKYFPEAERLLIAHGAKTWKEIFPDSEFTPDSSFFRSPTAHIYRNVNNYAYQVMLDHWSDTGVPGHRVALYDELFEACVNGDKAKIESLCLPKDGGQDSSEQPLQITASWGGNDGATPLSLAIQHRHWQAAQLILAISIAQYKPKDKKPLKFSVREIKLNEDSDEDSDVDSDEDMESDDEEINFIDIAKRPSQVQVNVSPLVMLQERIVTYPKGDRKAELRLTPLTKAVYDDDFEAFVQIADLYKTLPSGMTTIPDGVHYAMLEHDRVSMLDELIRRTGVGIDVPETKEEEESATTDADKKKTSKTYLGLNVHGKKRKDLVQKVDPNAPGATSTKTSIPLLWVAAKQGAVEVVRYLSTERAVDAYQYYAKTHSDERAKYLRKTAAQIPQLLGWSQNVLNESVFTAAVLGDQLKVLETIVGIGPAECQEALMSRIHFAGFNNILVAAQFGCSPELYDFLLSKGVSPIETDYRGWNIYHILCTGATEKHKKLLEHIFAKLPEDVSNRLLMQQSKGRLNTPLHIAVKRNAVGYVKILTKTKASCFLLRDQNGSTALHHAVRQSMPQITTLLNNAGPAEGLYMEDGVGNTPLEVATQLWIKGAQASFVGVENNIRTLDDNLHPYTEKTKGVSTEEVALLKDTIKVLTEQGRLPKGTKLSNALNDLAAKLEAKANRPAAVAEPKDEDEDEEEAEDNYDKSDANAVLKYLLSAVTARPGRRVLVHLDDVHRSVGGSLQRSSVAQNAEEHNDDDGLGAEVVEDTEEKAKKASVMTWFQGYTPVGPFVPDTF